MRLHTALIAATVLSTACVSDEFAPLRADWAGAGLDIVVDGTVVDSVNLPYSFEIPDSEGAIQTLDMHAMVDEENVLTITTAYDVTVDGTSVFAAECDQAGELTLQDDGMFTGSMPEATLGQEGTCGAFDASCSLNEDADELTCDMVFADTENADQRVTFMVAEGDTAE